MRWLVTLVATSITIGAVAQPVSPPKRVDSFALEAMQVFLEGPHDRAVDYVRRMGDLYDPTYIPLLIELHTTQLMGARVEPPSEHILPVLSRITRQTFSYPWDWIEWYASTDHQPPAGFIGWKGRIFSQFHPRFADLLAPGRATRIRSELLVWNGVGPEGVPPLYHPPTLRASEATFLTDEDPVVGLSVGGAQRAYPIRVLDWHEIVNDELSGLPLAVTYCVLCGTAIVYDARATDGRRYTFGNAGLVLNSNTLVFDHQTETLWLRMTGEPVLGPLVQTNTRLERMLPAVVTSWGAWRAHHPDTDVVSTDTGYDRDYGPGAAYGEYLSASETMFPVARNSDALRPKAWTFGIRHAGGAKAYALTDLMRYRVAVDEVGGAGVVIVATGSPLELRGHDANAGPVHYSAGLTARAYATEDVRFQANQDGTGTLVDAAGNQWRVTEDGLHNSGRVLPRVFSHQSYWFAWQAFFPGSELWQPRPAAPRPHR